MTTIDSPFYPSGHQIQLSRGNSQVVVTQVGATLRSYEVDGHQIIWAFNENEVCSAGRGQVLAPWPGRIQDGQYSFAGVRGVAGLDDSDRCCAIHGLVRWVPWKIREIKEESTQLEYWLAPQPAYPFSLRLAVSYTLNDEGLLVQYEAVNLGEQPIPFGIGFHPYFAVSKGSVDTARIHIPADTHLVLDNKGLPVGAESVADTSYDFRPGAPIEAYSESKMQSIGKAHLSECFTDLRFGEDDRWRVVLQSDEDSEASVMVWGDRSFRYILVFTGDPLAESIRRRAVAIEPMTCPPNALRTGEGLIILEPGIKSTGSWGISPSVILRSQ